MHNKNQHIKGYDFTILVSHQPELSKHVIKNKFNNQDTIDFSNPKAVKLLNSALLKSYYGINYWDIPDGYLCPAIPGRLDYLLHLHDLISSTPFAQVIKNKSINVLDIGTGASCIYPILGQSVFNWNFIATDIDKVSIQSANKIIAENKQLKNKITCRLQASSDDIFNGVVKSEDFFHLTLCNPPFHRSLAEASKGTSRKWKNLKQGNNVSKEKEKENTLNFGGQKAELWCPGGELTFIKKMIKQSQKFSKQVFWFTCLVSKKEHLSKLKLNLKKSGAKQVNVISMAQGNKNSRFIAWSFFHEQ